MRKWALVASAAAIVGAFGAVGTAAAATTKTETFSIILTSNTSDVASAIATGAFTAGGTALLIGGSSCPSCWTVHFADGTFKFVKTGAPKGSKDITGCLYSKAGSGTYKLSGGTGAYKGISGSGEDSVRTLVVYPVVKGGCGSDAIATQFVISASGPVSLP
jgi:hypothetical protein